MKYERYKGTNRLLTIFVILLLLTSCSEPNNKNDVSSPPLNETEVQPEQEDPSLKTVSANFNIIETQYMFNDVLYFSDMDNIGRSKLFYYDLSSELLTQKDWRHSKNVVKVLPLSTEERIDIESLENKFKLIYYNNNDPVELSNSLLSENGNYFVRMSPNKTYLYWIEQLANGKPRFVTYRIEDRHKTIIYTIDASMKYDTFMNEMQISPNGEKFYSKPYIYISSTGTRQWRLPGYDAVWSQHKDVIAFTDEINRDKLYLFYPSDGTTVLLYTEEDGIIMNQLSWDHSSQYVSFATGKMSLEDNQYYYEQVHIVDIQGGYHHIENERNSRIKQMKDFAFSPDNTLFSYVANSELKVIQLSTGQAQVIAPIELKKHMIIYGSERAFYVENNQVMMLDQQLRPKPVYESGNQIFDLYFSEHLRKMIVLEEGDSSQYLKVITLEESDLHAYNTNKRRTSGGTS